MKKRGSLVVKWQTKKSSISIQVEAPDTFFIRKIPKGTYPPSSMLHQIFQNRLLLSAVRYSLFLRMRLVNWIEKHMQFVGCGPTKISVHFGHIYFFFAFHSNFMLQFFFLQISYTFVRCIGTIENFYICNKSQITNTKQNDKDLDRIG